MRCELENHDFTLFGYDLQELSIGLAEALTENFPFTNIYGPSEMYPLAFLSGLPLVACSQSIRRIRRLCNVTCKHAADDVELLKQKQEEVMKRRMRDRRDSE